HCALRVLHSFPARRSSDLSYRYAEGEPWVLRNLSLVIEAGDSVAIVGRSGCGKTTLFKLMLGLLTPTEGEILFGGIPVRQLGPQDRKSTRLNSSHVKISYA